MPDGLAAEKFEILCSIFERARAQRLALERDDLDTFMRILDERDDLIGQLQRLMQESPALPENVVMFPTELNTLSRQDDSLALDTVIRGIVEHDDLNERMLNEKLETLAAELPALRHGRQAIQAYRVPRDQQGYIDHVS
jgi:hypothetical protein